jgi:hypothetical protein
MVTEEGRLAEARQISSARHPCDCYVAWQLARGEILWDPALEHVQPMDAWNLQGSVRLYHDSVSF